MAPIEIGFSRRGFKGTEGVTSTWESTDDTRCCRSASNESLVHLERTRRSLLESKQSNLMCLLTMTPPPHIALRIPHSLLITSAQRKHSKSDAKSGRRVAETSVRLLKLGSRRDWSLCSEESSDTPRASYSHQSFKFTYKVELFGVEADETCGF